MENKRRIVLYKPIYKKSQIVGLPGFKKLERLLKRIIVIFVVAIVTSSSTVVVGRTI
jgi:hypothetical protein